MAASIADCPTPSRCLGDKACAVGSVGIACSSCDLAATPKYFSLNGECVQCPEDTGMAMIVISIIAIAAFMFGLSHLTEVKPDADEGAVKMLGSIASIAFGHFQMAVHIFTLPAIPWPLWLKRVMELLRNIAFISFADFAQPECQADVDDPEQMFLLKYFLKQGIFALLFGTFFAMFLTGWLTGHSGMRNHAVNSMTALFSICFLLLVRSNAAIWDCSANDGLPARCSDPFFATEEDCPCGQWLSAVEERSTVDEFPDMTCSGSTYWAVAIFSAVSLILYVIVLPAFFLRKLSNAKKAGTLVDADTKAQFGWLFLRYKFHACHYYEFIAMARKALIVLAGMFVSSNPSAVLALTLAILCGSLLVHCKLLPYADHELDHSDEDSHDRSVWTEPDKLDALGMTCEILPLIFSIYFLNLGDNPERDFLYYAVSSAALIISIVPLVTSVVVGWRAHLAQKEAHAAAEGKGKGKGQTGKAKAKRAKEFDKEEEYVNPVGDVEKGGTKGGKGKKGGG